MADDFQTSRRPGFLIRFMFYCIIPVVVIGVAGYFYTKGGRYITTENAYVKADIVQIGTNIDGLITRVYVGDNETVEAGALLFTIDARPYEKELAVAEADVATARQTIEAQRARYRQGQVAIQAADERVRYLKKEFERQDELLQKGHGTQARVDETRHDLNMARRDASEAREDLQSILAALAGDADIPVEQHPAYLHAEAKRQIAALNLSYAKVRAPTAGVLTRVTVEPGEFIESGDLLLAIVSNENLWVEANLKEVDLEHLNVGQRATVVLDSLPDIQWQATVSSVSPATGSEFSVIPAQNATGNWVKVVQRVPVKLILADRPGSDALRAGLTAAVSIDTERERDLAAIIGSVFAQSSKPAAD